MLRRVAIAAKAAASGAGHGELSVAISEEKKVYETIMKLIAAHTDAAIYSYKWASCEMNKTIQDVFLKMCGLTSVWAEVQNEFAQKYNEYRECLKEILQEEKSIDDVRKQENICASRLTKLTKQVEVAKRKSDPAKLEPLLAELKQATDANDKAYKEVEKITDYVEAFKARRLRESLVLMSQAYLTLANRMTEIFSAQMQMAQLITSDTVSDLNTVSCGSSYEACSEKSRSILKEACLNLGYPVPHLPGDQNASLKPYSDESCFPDTRYCPPFTSPSKRGPLPLPSQLHSDNTPGEARSTSPDYSAGYLTIEKPPAVPPRPVISDTDSEPEYAEIRNAQVAHAYGIESGDVDKDVSKSVKDDGKEGTNEKPSKVQRIRNMYEWVWQRQSIILSPGDSREYIEVSSDLPRRQAVGSRSNDSKTLEVVGEESSEENLDEYLVLVESVKEKRVESNVKQRKPQAARVVSDAGASRSNNPIILDGNLHPMLRKTTSLQTPFKRSPNIRKPRKSTSASDVFQEPS